MATKLIPDLSATSSPLADGDLVVIEKADGTGTKKMTFAQLCQAVATKNYVNNGTTTASYKALDARYGKTLTDQVSTLNSRNTSISSGTVKDYTETLITQGKQYGYFLALTGVTDTPDSTQSYLVEYRTQRDISRMTYLTATQFGNTGWVYFGSYSTANTNPITWAQVDTKNNRLFTWQGVSTTSVTSVGANTVSDTEIACYLEGYKPIGILQWNIGSGGNHVSIVYVRIMNDSTSAAKVRFRLINNSDTAVTPSDLSATVLYIKA